MDHRDPSSLTVFSVTELLDNLPHDPLRTAVQPPLGWPQKNMTKESFLYLLTNDFRSPKGNFE